jgi:Mrp family chromosome partitioning ATPase
VNDPDQTMRLPVVEARNVPNGIPPRKPLPPKDTIIPPKDAATRNTTNSAEAGLFRLEPTVFSAIRRYRIMILVIAILGLVVAGAYAAIQPKVYQAEANVTVPLPASSQVGAADVGQYVDNQVVLLTSEGVAQRAADIANSELGANVLDAADFNGSHGKLVVNPPTTATPGGYGASIIAVSFRGPSPQVAQVGLSAVLQAFDEAVSDAIRAQANGTIEGIDRAIRQSTSQAQRDALETQRAQALVNEQTDLAQTPTTAVTAPTRANGHWTLDAGIGLVAGLLVGAALAYVLSVRRRGIAGWQDPAVIYGMPMIARIPVFKDGPVPMADDPDSAVAEAFRFAAVSVERICAAPGTSLAFISLLGDAGKSTVVANLALAMAEGGTRLLAVDADPADDGLTTRLLPGVQIAGGLEQVLSGRRALADCVRPSPHNHAITVIGSSPDAPRMISGAARSKAVRALLAEARRSFDVVLIDSPALLEVADSFELVNAVDAAIIVINPDEKASDHLEMADRFRSGGSDVIGYVYNRAPMRANVARHRHRGQMARPTPEKGESFTNIRVSDTTSQPSR